MSAVLLLLLLLLFGRRPAPFESVPSATGGVSSLILPAQKLFGRALLEAAASSWPRARLRPADDSPRKLDRRRLPSRCRRRQIDGEGRGRALLLPAETVA